MFHSHFLWKIEIKQFYPIKAEVPRISVIEKKNICCEAWRSLLLIIY